MSKGNLLIAGDLFPTACNIKLFKQGDIDNLFGKEIVDLFQNADYSVCNLEGVFIDCPLGKKVKASGPIIYAENDAFKAIKQLGVKCLATANNHIMDCLYNGYVSTRSLIEQSNIDYVGSGYNKNDVKKYISVNISGKNVCVYNVAETMYNVPTDSEPGVNIYDEYLVCNELNKLKKKHDYLIVIYHGGTEFFAYPTPLIRKRFHRMVDSGADLITSQHTHCLGCEEWYGGAYLLYGGGNFLFSRHSGHCSGGLLLEIKLDGVQPVIIKHHFVHTGIGVKYDESQNIRDFEERSSHINDGEFLYDEFKKFSLTQYEKMTAVFQPYSFVDRFFNRLLPLHVFDAYRKRYRIKSLNKKQILSVAYTLESEQQWETMLAMMHALKKD